MNWWKDPSNRSPVIDLVVSWVDELRVHACPNIPGSSMSYLNWLVQEDRNLDEGFTVQNDSAEDGGNNSCNGIFFIDEVAKKLSDAAIFIYLEDYASALHHLRQLLSLENLQLPSKNRKAVQIIRDSLFWTLGFLYGGIDVPTVMNYNWALEVGGDHALEAILDFMKARLGEEMGLPAEMVLVFLQQAVFKDKKCQTWYHYTLQKLQEIRTKDGLSIRPSKEEEKIAEAGYELSEGKDFIALTDYANHIKQVLWLQNEHEWNLQVEEYMTVIRLYSEAIKLAEHVGCKEWTARVKLFLANFLAFGKGQNIDHQKGKEMLDSMILEYPTDYLVFQIAAKIYHKGVYKDASCIDFTTARALYERAIWLNCSSFTTIFGYLRLLKEQRDHRAMINAIDKTLQDIEEADEDKSIATRLRNIKAYIIWIYNPERKDYPKLQAREIWLSIVTEKEVEYIEDICNPDLDMVFDNNLDLRRRIKSELREYFGGSQIGLMGRYKKNPVMLQKFVTFLQGLGVALLQENFGNQNNVDRSDGRNGSVRRKLFGVETQNLAKKFRENK